MELGVVIFGLLLAFTMILAWGSDTPAYQKIAMLLLGSWSASNVCVALLAYARAPMIIPSIDALIAVMAAGVSIRARSETGLAVVLLFVVEEVTHALAYASGATGHRDYYIVLNVIFLAQVLIVGGVSGERALRHWSDRIPQRGHHHGARV